MTRLAAGFLCLCVLSASCTVREARAQQGSPTATAQQTLPLSAPSPSTTPSTTPSPALSPTTTLTTMPSVSPIPSATSLRATVNARFLSCRYGPGPEYLYLYALRAGANISLVGRTDGDNWHWAWVAGRSRCWVNTSYLSVQGDLRQLPVVYPGTARLPVSPYYPATSVVSVVRHGSSVTVEWRDIPLRAGDEEDQFMQHYIIETWRCQAGRLLFEPLATNYSYITFIDEPGCAQASHGRVFVQEKHGFAGPTNVPWPSYQ
jgi:uncharacterized protein YraI